MYDLFHLPGMLQVIVMSSQQTALSTLSGEKPPGLDDSVSKSRTHEVDLA